MERRGFIGKFARVAVGAALSLQSLVKDDRSRAFPGGRRPKLVRVFDETVFKESGVNAETLKIMLKAGIREAYSHLPALESVKAVFPGLGSGAGIGIRIQGFPPQARRADELVSAFRQALGELANEPKMLEGEKVIVWSRNDAKSDETALEEESESIIRVPNLTSGKINPNDENHLPSEDILLQPHPLLETGGIYHTLLISFRGNPVSGSVCQRSFLNCFRCDRGDDFIDNLEEREIQRLYEAAAYPLSMKFRLFVLERLEEEKVLYFSSEGLLLDNHFDSRLREAALPKIEPREIVNPSAPLVESFAFKKGEDMEVNWREEDYNGRDQIYRGENGYSRPRKKNLIGITDRKKFTDPGGAKLKNQKYLVTREWGD